MKAKLQLEFSLYFRGWLVTHLQLSLFTPQLRSQRVQSLIQIIAMGDKGETIMALSPLDSRIIPYARDVRSYVNVSEWLSRTCPYVEIATSGRPRWKLSQAEVCIPKHVGRDGVYSRDFEDLTGEISYDELQAESFLVGR